MKEKNQNKSTLDEIAKHINKLPSASAIQEHYSAHRLQDIKKHAQKALELNPTGKKKMRLNECLNRIENVLSTTTETCSHPSSESSLPQWLDCAGANLSAAQLQQMQSADELKTIPELANAFSIEQLIQIRDQFNLLRVALVKELHQDTRSIQLGSLNRKISKVNDHISRCNKAVSMNQRKAKKLRNLEVREKQLDRTCERSYNFLKEFMAVTSQRLSDRELEQIKAQVHQSLDHPAVAA